ncbi:MAG TPA: phospho-N-acetylmuramoyl-pentapeptide-transferase [Acidimicrobiales bacterium]|nr:phospho-N-acetylmuramoyl-pentapeptide-transferase [Acidimicrobiales bacterium]
MIAVMLAGGLSMVFALIGTPLFIRWQRAQGLGQPIRVDGPSGHHTKAGTPTMGGLVIVVAAAFGYFVSHLRAGAYFSRAGLLIIAAVLLASAIGLVDDWLKVHYRNSLGLDARLKMGLLVIVAAGFAIGALSWASARTELAFTRYDSIGLDLGTVGWVLLAMLMLTATTNAVNFTDGLDGLAAGSSAFSFGALVIIGFWQFRNLEVYAVPQALDLALTAAALTGACIGFLWWNAPPARIIMGDTGSLGIGAGLAGLSLVMNLHLLLPVLGGLFVLEVLSDIVQVVGFKLFRRRVFRMAPIHHHFELMNWPETTVVVRFWILAGLCTALALGVFYADFIHLGGID